MQDSDGTQRRRGRWRMLTVPLTKPFAEGSRANFRKMRLYRHIRLQFAPRLRVFQNKIERQLRLCGTSVYGISPREVFCADELMDVMVNVGHVPKPRFGGSFGSFHVNPESTPGITRIPRLLASTDNGGGVGTYRVYKQLRRCRSRKGSLRKNQRCNYGVFREI